MPCLRPFGRKRNHDYAVGQGRHLATCEWIRAHQNVLITGSTGVGKTFLACALANAACRQGLSARCFRVPRLRSELTMAKGDGSYPKLLTRLARIHLRTGAAPSE